MINIEQNLGTVPYYLIYIYIYIFDFLASYLYFLLL